jgi:hypothetical protein
MALFRRCIDGFKKGRVYKVLHKPLPTFHEWLMCVIRTEGELYWDNDEDRRRTVRYFESCPKKELLCLSPWYYDDDRWPCPCCDGYNEKWALILYDGITVASLTNTDEDDKPPILKLNAPASKEGDGNFRLPKEELVYTFDGFSKHPIKFGGANWHEIYCE